MISSITLLNYGPHRHSTMTKLGVANRFKGSNKAGKTWILKAIIAAMTCKGITETDMHDGPSGKAKSASIELKFTDGRRLLLERKGATQSVTLEWPDGTTRHLTGIRQAASVVQEFTGLVPINTDATASKKFIQIKELYDNVPFMVTWSPEAVLHFITSLTPNPNLNKAAKLVNKKVSQLPARIEANKELLRKTEDRLSLIDLDKVARLEDRAKKLQKAVERLQELRDIRDAIKQAKQLASEMLSTEDMEFMLSKAEAAVEQGQQYKSKVARYNHLKDISSLLKEMKDKVEEAPTLTDLVSKQTKVRAKIDKAQEERKKLISKLVVCPNCGEIIEGLR